MKKPTGIFIPYSSDDKNRDRPYLLTIYQRKDGAIEMDQNRLTGWSVSEDGRCTPETLHPREADERGPGYTVLKQVIRRFDDHAHTWLPTPWECLEPFLAEGLEYGRRIALGPMERKDVRDRLTLRSWTPVARRRFHGIKAALQAGEVFE